MTDIAIKARQAIKFGIIIAIFGIIARIAIFVGLNVYHKSNPPKPPPPSAAYGRIEEIKFPKQTVDASKLTYKLETPSGGLPILPDRMHVYVMPTSTSTLFSLDESTAKAKALGFNVQPVQISDTIYRYNNNAVPSALEINIVTGVFTSSYNLAFDPTPLQKRPPDQEAAIRKAIEVLKGARVAPEDISEEEAKYEFLDVEGQNLVSTVSLSEAKLVKVNVFRANIVSKTKEGEEVKYPAKPADPNEANIWIILSGESTVQKAVIASQFFYYPVDYKQFETYPIITAQEAWDKLLAGEAYIANRGLNSGGEVVIRNVYLAYYDPNVLSQYFQPIVVFEGDDGFVAYVPAVTSLYYGAEPTPSPAPSGGN